MEDQTAGADASGAQGPSRADCCPGTLSLPTPVVAADVEVLATLGNETRYGALRLIAEAESSVCVCELEPPLGVSQGAVSQALSRLFDAGLVTREKQGRWRYYDTTPRAERLLAVLDETRGEPAGLDETRDQSMESRTQSGGTRDQSDGRIADDA
ncbi:MAG: metalloregulator ArsR/SmtB family transcription factor [Haloarculaceae archaeon]